MTGAGPARTRLQAAAAARPDPVRRPRRRAGAAPPALSSSPARGHGQVAAIVGEAGVGKSRLVYEFSHSHRLQGWLILESASVSYGKATSYLPVIDLLKGYFKIQERDDLREIREKVTGKLLTLDRALEPTLPALLALLDVPVDDPAWQALDPGQRRQRTLDAVQAVAAPGSQRATAPPDLRGPPLDRQRDPGVARRPGRQPRLGAPAAARELPARVPARLGRQDLLQPAAAGPAAGRERRGAAGGAAGRRSRPRPAQAAPREARGQPVLPGGERPDAGGDEGAGGGARTHTG